MSKLTDLTLDIIRSSEKWDAQMCRRVSIDSVDAFRIAQHLFDQGWRKVEYPQSWECPACGGTLHENGACTHCAPQVTGA